MNISDCSLKCLQKHMKLKQIFQYPLPILLAGGPHVILSVIHCLFPEYGKVHT